MILSHHETSHDFQNLFFKKLKPYGHMLIVVFP
jgi:hypothetical protein